MAYYLICIMAAIFKPPFYRLQEERERQAQLRGPPKIDPYNAATTIQKVFCRQLIHLS